MKPEHLEEIPQFIRDKYGAQFKVLAGKTNYLPDRTRHWYQPDVILKSLSDPHDIRYIIEIECDPVRKALAGACILADCSIEVMQTAKAGLIFIVYSPEGKRRFKDFVKRVEILKPRCPHLSIQVVRDEDFKEGKDFEIKPDLRSADS